MKTILLQQKHIKHFWQQKDCFLFFIFKNRKQGVFIKHVLVFYIVFIYFLWLFKKISTQTPKKIKNKTLYMKYYF